jgi:pentatricopeptide repeat protein
MIRSTIKKVAVIVAHPDDETLWAGGTMLSHPSWNCFVTCLSRKNDTDRAAKFYKALQVFKCQGIMGDLDDGPAQKPLADKEVQRSILELLPNQHFDLDILHSPLCKYNRHIRHEKVGRTVIKLWHSSKISTTELWSFAYSDSKPE